MQKFYITTPIYYVNDKPHLGHAYTTVIGDVFARYYRQKMGTENVFFLTGTDEHGAKIAQSATRKKLSPQEFTDQISLLYQDAWKELNISHDYFFRTTQTSHKIMVQDILQKIYDKGLIYKANYKGIYCVGCEKYLTDDEINNGICPLHPSSPLLEQEEENYFFKLSEFTEKILQALKTKEYNILPNHRKNEIIKKIESGITDISISRKDVSWGIPLPWDKDHTVYVWVDALFNYYTATVIAPNRAEFWPASLHLMAKDILWFHAVIWEAFLFAIDEKLPKTIFAHGFFTLDGQKMSKSLGNTIAPSDLIKIFGTDGVRYLLLTSFPFGNDGDINISRFNEKYNADLANGLGNLISRVAKLCESSGFSFQKVIKKYSYTPDPDIDQAMEEYRPDEAIKIIWEKIQSIDQDIYKKKTWTLKGVILQSNLEEYVLNILKIADDLKPFLPETSKKISETFLTGDIKKPSSLFERIKP